MAYPQNFLRLVVSGTLYTNETFSYGLSFASEAPALSAPETVPADVITALTTFHTSSGAYLSSASKMNLVKLNMIGPDGRYVSKSETVQHEFDPVVAGSGTPALPPQCAIAITLRTAARRGLANSGRIFLPCLVNTGMSDGRLDASTQQTLAATVTTLLDDLDEALVGWRPAVVSNVREGAQRFIKNVEVGKVVDTIRSRRSSLNEDYFAGPDLTNFSGGGGGF